MIEVLSIQKKQEGILNKYFWDFKINNKLHNVQFVDLPFGKKQVWIDQVEVLDSRIFVGSSLLFPFEIDNYDFEIRADAEDYDIYEKKKLNAKLKNILLEQNFTQKKTNVTQKDRYINMGNTNQNINQLAQKQKETTQKQQFSKEDEFFNFDNFHDEGQKTDPFEEEQEQKKNKNSNFDDFNFNQNSQQKFRIFDDNSKVTPQNDTKNLVKIKKMNLVYDSSNQQYKVSEDNKDIEDQFYTSDDFDKQLEQQLQNQKKGSGFYKSPFDMDPEEAVDSLNNGFKNVFNKTKNLVSKIEDKCKVMMNKYDTSDNINNQESEDFKNFGANIKMFDDDFTSQDIYNIQQNKMQKNYTKEENNNVQQNFPSQDTPFLEEYINENKNTSKKSNSLNDFNFNDFNTNSKKIQITQKKNKDQDLLEKVLSEDFLNLDQKISTPFD